MRPVPDANTSRSPAALILAGSRGGVDPLASANGVPHKALIEVGGASMLARVAAALRGAGLTRIIVSTNDAAVDAAAAALGLGIVAAADGPSRSVGLAIDQVGTPLLVTTADHALLDPAWVTAFLGGVPAQADVAVMLARRAAIEAAVPDTRRTYLRFADGDWSGCNLFFFATPRAVAAVALWERVEADRKRPWRIIRRFGPLMLVRYLLGQLTLTRAIAHLGGLAGIDAAVVESPAGLAAVDVDTAGDLVLVRRIVGG
ncbi:MAG TPA: NTP transferase domain-containing protein [Sphingomonas sp.]